MGRPQRVDEPGARHLVTNRGTAQTMLFRADADRRRFLALVGNLGDGFGVAVLAYVLMGNHYHLVVRSNEGRLAEAMQHLDGTYARGFNAIHDRQGALFQGRYDAQLLDNQPGLAAAGFYVHLNPLRAGLTRDPARYRWSSLGAYARERAALPWLHLDLMAGTGSAYLTATLAAAGLTCASPGVGADDYEDFYSEWSGDDPKAATFSEWDRDVASVFGVSVDELYIVARGRTNVARMAAMALALRLKGLPAGCIADRYGARSARTVHSAVQRLRERAASDPGLAARIHTLGGEL